MRAGAESAWKPDCGACATLKSADLRRARHGAEQQRREAAAQREDAGGDARLRR